MKRLVILFALCATPAMAEQSNFAVEQLYCESAIQDVATAAKLSSSGLHMLTCQLATLAEVAKGTPAGKRCSRALDVYSAIYTARQEAADDVYIPCALFQLDRENVPPAPRG